MNAASGHVAGSAGSSQPQPDHRVQKSDDHHRQYEEQDRHHLEDKWEERADNVTACSALYDRVVLIAAVADAKLSGGEAGADDGYQPDEDDVADGSRKTRHGLL